MTRIIRAAEGRRVAWKNGGGETVEIVACPAGAGLDDFSWRLSCARIAADGPFSTFPGVQRSLALLDGAGLVLRVADRELVLDGGSAPAQFPGDTPVAALLTAGPVTVLNVMARGRRIRHAVHALASQEPLRLRPAGRTMLVFCAAGRLSLGAIGQLQAGDAAIVDASAAAIAAEGGAALQVIAIAAQSGFPDGPMPGGRG